MGTFERIKASLLPSFESLTDFRLKRKRPVTSSGIYYNFGASPKDSTGLETYFVTEDRRKVPVFSNYRYSVKPGWKYFESMIVLDRMRRLGAFDEKPGDLAFLKRAQGTRTLGAPLTEITTKALHYSNEFSHYFLPENSPNGKNPILRPDLKSAQAIVNETATSHRKLFNRIEKLGLFSVKPGMKILEIGFISGGHSLFAMERIGLLPTGIDNEYGGLSQYSGLPHHLREILGSRVDFKAGDITRETPFAEGYFDVVYSSSTLEHIREIPAAFREIRRLLRPGGIMLHTYHPFFCPSGGHALGISDSPWGHVRMSEKDSLRYADELRPFESEETKNWIRQALTRDFPLAKMQRAITLAGFELGLWQEYPADRADLKNLSREILEDAFHVNPEISMSDLTTQTVLLLAKKPALS